MLPKSILQWKHIDDEFPQSPDWRCLIMVHGGNDLFVVVESIFSFDAGVFMSIDCDEEEYPACEMSYWARLPESMILK